MTKIQIFTTEDSYPHEITGRSNRNEIINKKKIEVEEPIMQEYSSMTIMDVLRNKDNLAAFLVDNQNLFIPNPWIDFCYRSSHQCSPESRELYDELFPEREVEIAMCKRWLSANFRCDKYIRALNNKQFDFTGRIKEEFNGKPLSNDGK